jgi:hypothetical protein
MEDITEPAKPKQKRMDKKEWIGLIIGIFIAILIFQIGNFGVIPVIIIFCLSHWIGKIIASFFIKTKVDVVEQKVNVIEKDVQSKENSESTKEVDEIKTKEQDSKKKWIWGGVILIIFIIILIFSSSDKSIDNSESKEINYKIEIGQNIETKIGWQRINIGNIATIDYPTELLELQGGDYKEIIDIIKDELNFGNFNFSLQQKGLNDLTESSFDDYARVLFKTLEVEYGGLFNITERPPISESELVDFSLDFEKELINGFKLQFEDMKLIDFEGVEIRKINNTYPIVMSYTRQLDDNPIVAVEQYQFWDNNKIYQIIFSYQVRNEYRYKEAYDEMIKTFIVK